MNYRTLGLTGTKMSELCFGTWRFGLETDDGTVETTREEAPDVFFATRPIVNRAEDCLPDPTIAPRLLVEVGVGEHLSGLLEFPLN